MSGDHCNTIVTDIVTDILNQTPAYLPLDCYNLYCASKTLPKLEKPIYFHYYY